jgi:hypothetical protein
MVSKGHKILIFTLLFLGAGGTTTALSQSAPRSAVFQSWNEVQLIVPLLRSQDAKGKNVDRVTTTFSGIARLGRKDDLVDGRMGFNIDFRVNEHLSLLTGVVYRRDELTKNEPHSETRITVGGTLSAIVGLFSIRDRNMYERRVRNQRNDTNVYRNRLQIYVPLKRDGKTLFSPFISEEAFYDITAGRGILNEFFAGVSRNLAPRTALEIAYIRADGKPANVNGLSLTLKITLR